MNIAVTDIKDRLYYIANILIVFYGFSLVFSHKISTKIALVLLLIWIVTGDFKDKFKNIVSDKFILIFLLYIGLFLIGLLWTEDIKAGLHIAKRPLLLLIVPIIYTLYQKRFIKIQFYSLVVGLIVTSILIIGAYYNFINIKYNAAHAPFMNRNYIATMLAFSASFLLYMLLSTKRLFQNLLIGIVIIITIYALTITASRGGLLILLIGFFIVLIYRFGISFKKVFMALIVTALTFILIYNSNDTIKHRIDNTVKVLKKFDLNKQVSTHKGRTALTCRFEFWYYAYNIGKNKPLLGAGTGDGIAELENYIGKKETKKLFSRCRGNGSGQFNPHNMILFMFMQFGLVGLFLILYFAYLHFKVAYSSKYVPLILFVTTSWIFLLTSSALFTTRFFIPYYGFGFVILYLIYKEYYSNEVSHNK